MKRILIIGGLSAGPSAAAKARRENEEVEIILFEKSPNISYATCGIPYAISGTIPSRDKLLVVEANLLRDRFNIDVRLDEEVLDINPVSKLVITSKGTYDYDSLIFTTGARPFVPPIKNLDKGTNWSTCRSLADFDKIMNNGILDSVKNISILGAGLIGVEVAENIRKLGKNVTLIEGLNQILPMWQPKFSHMAQLELENKGIIVKKGFYVDQFNYTNDGIHQIQLSNGDIIESDFIIISTGIKPNTELLTKKGAQSIDNGALIVNNKMETSLPNIYAAGDNVSLINMQTRLQDYFPLGTHSNKGGRVAGANAVGGAEIMKGAYKTAIIKTFDYTLARTGLNAKDLDQLNWNYKTNLIVAGATPGYYPGAKDIIIEIYYDPNDQTILGAELFGEVGVDKRVDVLSTAIYAKLKITDLAHLDLAYAPPFSPAKDPVIVNGFVSSNSINGNYQEISAEDLSELFHSDQKFQILDVRTKAEMETEGFVENALSFDLNKLRDEMTLLDPEIETIVYCAKGLRGYLASRILKHNGFENVKNVSGGFKLIKMQYPSLIKKQILAYQV